MEDTLKECISKISDIDVSKISGSDRIDSLGLDSFALVCLVSELSDSLGIELNIDEMANIETVDDFSKYLEMKKS